MGVVVTLLVVLAGAGIAGGVGAIVVNTQHPDKVVELQQQAAEPEVIDYGSR
ncbi:hypothetical protein Lesp02_08430 [Lentzea sp. NBRC 105346]|uniref:hypothetical protein n=1 Tax=Lentzea sp. NBRC 105346 TaxID=3032205 RepID=UPI0024A5FA96|nr:hypothetical protein [Lentzea sp. NBRC 105346]GLZ28653.1 hypothetical protein Lesp02_08430 [Lentzea sp. NBRC 105346]